MGIFFPGMDVNVFGFGSHSVFLYAKWEPFFNRHQSAWDSSFAPCPSFDPYSVHLYLFGSDSTVALCQPGTKNGRNKDV
jgi:hypothetical protein